MSRSYCATTRTSSTEVTLAPRTVIYAQTSSTTQPRLERLRAPKAQRAGSAWSAPRFWHPDRTRTDHRQWSTRRSTRTLARHTSRALLRHRPRAVPSRCVASCCGGPPMVSSPNAGQSSITTAWCRPSRRTEVVSTSRRSVRPRVSVSTRCRRAEGKISKVFAGRRPRIGGTGRAKVAATGEEVTSLTTGGGPQGTVLEPRSTQERGGAAGSSTLTASSLIKRGRPVPRAPRAEPSEQR